MDKSIFTALNSMQILKNNQSVVSQKLSNTNVVGYKKDIQANFGSIYLDREKGIDPRVFAFSDVGAFDNSQGPLKPSERKLDLAIDGDGYFIVKPEGGKLALSRRGDLKVGIDGTLRDNAGAQIFSVDLEPIEIPPYRNISVANDGIITIEPLNAEPGQQVVVGQIASTKGSEEVKLVKSLDGFIKHPENFYLKSRYMSLSSTSIPEFSNSSKSHTAFSFSSRNYRIPGSIIEVSIRTVNESHKILGKVIASIQ